MNRTLYGQIAMAVITIAISAIFYANFREATWLGEYFKAFQAAEYSSLNIHPRVLEHLPSVLQTAFLAICFSLLPLKLFNTSINPVKSALLLAIIYEFLQLTPALPGTFDWGDICSIFITAFLFQVYVNPSPFNHLLPSKPIKSILLTLLFSGSYMASVGSGCIEECLSDYTSTEPVTLTWEELRAEIQPTYGDSITLIRPGKIYKKDEHLYIVDQYRGVHIFDISDNQNPIQLAFIPLIGALDLSIQGDYAYINSFTDLVVINIQSVLSRTFEQHHITRTENVFLPPGYYDFYPKYHYLNTSSGFYDDFIYKRYRSSSLPTKGFIIGYYATDGSQVLFGEHVTQEEE